MFRALLDLPVGKPTPALHIGSRMQKKSHNFLRLEQ
jgi:hypothetical protein